MTETAKRIGKWLADGETGLSSECMASVALGANPRRVHHPLDPADLNRCLKLLRAAPGVRRAFPKIRRLSKPWRAAIDHWDELEALFVEEVGWDWEKRREARRTYDRMKELGL